MKKLTKYYHGLIYSLSICLNESLDLRVCVESDNMSMLVFSKFLTETNYKEVFEEVDELIAQFKKSCEVSKELMDYVDRYCIWNSKINFNRLGSRKNSLVVNATYLGTTKPYHVYVGIIQIMNSGYVVKFYCDFTNLLSADCIKVAHTDEELRSVLENLRIGVLYHLFGGLEERLNESMMEYLSEVERLL